MPDEFREFGKTWEHLHPGWEMILWTEATLIPLKNSWAYTQLQSLAGKSDIARYEILSQYGGIYVDTDFECLKNLEPLLHGAECFVALENKNLAQNAIIGAVPGHPFLRDLVESLDKHVRTMPRDSPPIAQAGPQYLTRVLELHPEVSVFPASMFFPYQWHEPWRRNEKFCDAYAVHHWTLSWRPRVGQARRQLGNGSAPCLSVVIHSCNDALRLEWVLEGLCIQTVEDFEVIVVSDYDKAIRQLTETFGNRLAVHYRYDKSRWTTLRPGEARNHGLRYAQAQRTLFLAGDCLPDTDVVEVHAAFGDEGFVPFGFQRIYPSEKFYRFRTIVDYQGLRVHSSPDLRRSFPDRPFYGDWRDLMGFCFSAPTRALRKLDGFNERLEYGYDQDLAERLTRHKYRLLPMWNNGHVTQLAAVSRKVASERINWESADIYGGFV